MSEDEQGKITTEEWRKLVFGQMETISAAEKAIGSLLDDVHQRTNIIDAGRYACGCRWERHPDGTYTHYINTECSLDNGTHPAIAGYRYVMDQE